MQFNSNASLDDIMSDITEMTKMDLNEYPIEDRTRNANHWYFRLIQDIVRVASDKVFFDSTLSNTSDNGWTIDLSDGSATIPLVNAQRGYSLPTTNKPWIIYRVAYMRDAANYYDSSPFNIAELKGNLNTTIIDGGISADAPMHRYNGNKILMYPLPNQAVAAGLKIWYLPEPKKFITTDTTKVPEINEVFHKGISMGASYEKLRGKPRGETILRDLTALRAELRDFYASFLVDETPIARPEGSLPNYA
jgi:hypothetical protein